MILWINGAFGSGKSVVAKILHAKLDNSYIYDPEEVGYCMRKLQPGGVRLSDFQDEPLWREINYMLLKDTEERYQGTLIAPMTLYKPEYYREIIGRLRGDGVEVKHFLLEASRDEIHRRLRKRLDFKRSWPALQTEKCIAGFTNTVFENRINTENINARQAAGIILQEMGY